MVVASAVWLSVEPMTPNFHGLTPSFASYARPRLRASRVYSFGSMSGVFGAGPSWPLSQVSKSANSSFGESFGCASPSPFIWVVS